MNKSIIFILLALATLCCCSSKEDFNDIIVISGFTNACMVEAEAQQLDIDAIGILDFKAIDSLLLVSTNSKTNMWHIYRLPDCHHIKSLLDVGAGPYEVTMPVPLMYTSTFLDSIGDRHISFLNGLQIDLLI